MKRKILVLSAAFALVALSSCRKEMTFTADTSTWSTDGQVCITLAGKKDPKELNINWGDNTSTDAGNPTADFNVCHTYEVPGTYSITVTAKNYKAERLSVTIP